MVIWVIRFGSWVKFPIRVESKLRGISNLVIAEVGMGKSGCHRKGRERRKNGNGLALIGVIKRGISAGGIN